MHEAIGGWIDEVIEMKKGAGLGGITEEIFKKRQEMMWKIVEHIIISSYHHIIISSWSYSLMS